MKIIHRSAFLLLLLVIAYCAVARPNKKEKVWIETTGYIYLMPKRTYIYYKLRDTLGCNTHHTYRQLYYRTHVSDVAGEKFTMRYQLNHPKRIRIDYWNPIFQENETTKRVKGTVVKRGNNNFGARGYDSIIYSFICDGKKMTKVQNLPPDYKEKYPDLKKGQIYEVEYLIGNPLHCVMHLDKQLADSSL